MSSEPPPHVKAFRAHQATWRHCTAYSGGSCWWARSVYAGSRGSYYASVQPENFSWSALNQLGDHPAVTGVGTSLTDAKQAADVALDQLMAEGH